MEGCQQKISIKQKNRDAFSQNWGKNDFNIELNFPDFILISTSKKQAEPRMKQKKNSPHNTDQEKELERRQQQLEKREQLLRLRELENEIYEQDKKTEPPVYPMRKEKPTENRLKRWRRKIVFATKFLGFAIVALITVKIAYSLAIVIMVFGIGWLGYNMVKETDS